jgi:cysteine sulfinate desulfinase/cysteine desulfurase-like protein
MGKSLEEAHCALRFSLSQQTSEEEIDAVVTEIALVLDEMKNTVRFLSCK